jgi:hypothetical protein
MNTQVLPYKRPRANAQNIDIWAFILAWIAPPVGAIMGHVSMSQAKRAGYKASALATWAVVLGWLWFAVGVAIAVAFLVSVAVTVSQTGTGY